jgi:hypothetical protein
MVTVAAIYLRFYIEVGVGTFLQNPTPPKIPSDSDSTAMVIKASQLMLSKVKAAVRSEIHTKHINVM